jgi:AhpD family alkylhydroperoxidase
VALDSKIKELITLGIAIAGRCDGCIADHIHDAFKANATPEEIIELLGLSLLIGDGPALMYGAEAYEALQQF